MACQSSQKTLVDPFLREEHPRPSASSSRQNTLSEKSVSLPVLSFASKPTPLSPSKRGNRTYTTTEARRSSSGASIRRTPVRYHSSSSSLTEADASVTMDSFDDDDVAIGSDEEAPMYDSESERGSPRKKRRSKMSQDMSIDEISVLGLAAPVQEIRPAKLFAATGAFTSRVKAQRPAR